MQKKVAGVRGSGVCVLHTVGTGEGLAQEQQLEHELAHTNMAAENSGTR